jgi:mannose-binding lectin 2
MDGTLPLFRWLFLSLFLFPTWLAKVAHATPDGNFSHAERGMRLQTHSLYAPYIDQDLQNRWWDFSGDSYVNTNKHVRLTRPVPSQMGWLWSRLPISVPSYSVEVEFKVSGSSSHLFGDGLAMWITQERNQPGPIFGNKDHFTGLGIFLDTYANSRHTYSFPRVSGMIGDGQTSFDFGNDGDGQILGACSANFRRTNVVTKLKVSYVKATYLAVQIQYKAWDEWTDCFRIENATLPLAPFIGFSALTGDVFDAHDIIAVSTHALQVHTKSSPEKNPGLWRRPDAAAGGTSWFGLLFRIALFAGLCYGLYYAYQEYNRRKLYGGGDGGGGVNFGMRDGYGAGRVGGLGGMYENRRHF